MKYKRGMKHTCVSTCYDVPQEVMVAGFSDIQRVKKDLEVHANSARLLGWIVVCRQRNELLDLQGHGIHRGGGNHVIRERSPKDCSVLRVFRPGIVDRVLLHGGSGDGSQRSPGQD